jgi:hypothetical protein
MTQTAQAPTPKLPSGDRTVASLASLASLSFDALADLYGRGVCPRTVRPLDGAPKGRMLAVRGLGELPVAGLVRRFAASPAFVWDGKTFASTTDARGTGINRVSVPGALGRQRLFPFDTRLGASLLDGRPAFVLDYDLDANPGWIRRIHDEIREVAPGLYLGPAMWKGARATGTATIVLWFALDTRTAPSVGWS